MVSLNFFNCETFFSIFLKSWKNKNWIVLTLSFKIWRILFSILFIERNLCKLLCHYPQPIIQRVTWFYLFVTVYVRQDTPNYTRLRCQYLCIKNRASVVEKSVATSAKCILNAPTTDFQLSGRIHVQLGYKDTCHCTEWR